LLAGFQSADLAGSPYAVAGYRVAAEFGGDAALRRFRQELNRHGLRLILDFVPNHLGLDHPWVQVHPQRFVHAATPRPGTFRQASGAGTFWLAHGRDPNFPAWTDTVQLDLRRPDTRTALIAELQGVAARCDAIRCDMAMLVLDDVFDRTWSDYPAPVPRATGEFWAEAIPAVKGVRRNLELIAEAYWDREPELQELGFDFTYDKRFYDHLVTQAPTAVVRHLESQTPEFQARCLRFLENHDEQRASQTWPARAHRAAALLLLGLPGARLIHEGQLEGARRRVPVQLKRRPADSGDPEIAGIYRKLIEAVQRSSIGRGEARWLRARPVAPDDESHRHFALVQWQARPETFDLVVVNLSPAQSQAFAPVVVAPIAERWRLTDLLSPETHERDSAELRQRGLYLNVPGYATQIFHFVKAG
jgi:glycosidase